MIDDVTYFAGYKIDPKTRPPDHFRLEPGTSMKVDRQNLKVFSALVVDLAGQPGEDLRSDNELIVATGKGALSLAEVQLEGKRRMSAAEFLRGHGALVRGAR